MKKILSLIICSLLAIFLLVSCSSDLTRTGYCATFHLEGALYQQCDVISYYYDCDEGETLILEPNDIIENQANLISRVGYTLEGWYLSTEYKEDEKWDFSTHKMGYEGVTLYAHWVSNNVYTFNVISLVDNKTLGTYQVDEGDTFYDFSRFVDDVEGYTFIEYRDSNDPNNYNVIENDTYPHPGGDSDTAINIYAYFIQGEYTLVRTNRDLSRAIASGDNIYLLNDINYSGDILEFGDYSGILAGNGYTISNFEYNSSLTPGVYNISLFGNLTNATISDVTFDYGFISYRNNNQTTEINIYPFALSMTNSTITNVKVVYTNRTTNATALAKTHVYGNISDMENNNSTIDNLEILSYPVANALWNTKWDYSVEGGDTFSLLVQANGAPVFTYNGIEYSTYTLSANGLTFTFIVDNNTYSFTYNSTDDTLSLAYIDGTVNFTKDATYGVTPEVSN